MADNYLERKMEDFLSGKSVKRESHTRLAARKNGFFFPLSPKRVLIASESTWKAEIANLFLKAGCKVAMMHSSKPEGAEMAEKDGIRFYHINLQDSASPKVCFNDLLAAWRDVDILIADFSITAQLVEIWDNHREHFPYVADYVSRLIILGHSSPEKVASSLSHLKATVNSISLAYPHNSPAALIAMLALPSNNFISRMSFSD